VSLGASGDGGVRTTLSAVTVRSGLLDKAAGAAIHFKGPKRWLLIV